MQRFYHFANTSLKYFFILYKCVICDALILEVVNCKHCGKNQLKGKDGAVACTTTVLLMYSQH